MYRGSASTRLHARGWLLPLPLEHRVNQRELPGRRGFLRKDSVASSVEAQILRLISRLVYPGQPRSQMKIHVRQKRVLRHMKAHRDGGGIAVSDLDVDVTHRRI